MGIKQSNHSTSAQGASLAPPTKWQRSRSTSRAPSSHAPSATPTDGAASTSGNPSSSVKNGDLPQGTDITVWCRQFVPTLVNYISRHSNPWAVPSLKLVQVMQAIWNELFEVIPQDITTSSVTYRLVSAPSIIVILT